MVMDYLRSCFTTQMWLWGRDADPVPVRWFFATKGAKEFPYEHSFWCEDWEQDKGYHGPNDLIGDRGKYHKGTTPVQYPGDHFHGPAQAFIDGGRIGIDPALTTGPDGAIDECRIPPDSPPAWFVGSGGQAQGGSAPMHPGYTYVGTGGQAQGGSAPVAGSYGYVGTGGQAQGGSAPMNPGYSVVGTGGQAQGGSAPFWGSYGYVGTGGQAQGGSAPVTGSYAYVGTGGQAQGGSAPMTPGYSFVGTGGQAQGGSATVSGESCTAPTFVSAWRWQDTDLGGYWQLPAGTADGDLLVLIVLTEGFPVGLAIDDSWSTLGGDGSAVSGLGISVLYQFKNSFTPGSGIIFPTPDVATFQAVIAVRGAGTPYRGDAFSDGSATATAPTLDVVAACSFLLAAFGGYTESIAATAPSGDLTAAVSPEDSNMAVYYNPDVPAGAAGDRHVTFTGAVATVGMLVICPPA